MNDRQWTDLLATLDGRATGTIPCGFIVDSPWLPGWCGVGINEYLAHDHVWFEANRKLIETFPDVWFLPGFWAEFGMCTEPSAFGARSVFPADQFPFAEPALGSLEAFVQMKTPDPASDGLLPLVLERLKWARPRMEEIGHKIRFSVSRGPLNVAAFVMGSTEFLMAIKTEAALVHRFLRKITDFLKRWHDLQRSAFPSIEGILILDDFVGFVSEKDFVEFALPYFRELFATEVPVRFFHNDAPCERSVRYYPEIGINLFNPGVQTPLSGLRALTENRLTILGTVPPLDVLARGTPGEVRAAVRGLLRDTPDRSRLILSCAGGMPPAVTTENLLAFVDEARNSTGSCGAGGQRIS